MWPLSKIDLSNAIMYPQLIKDPKLTGYNVKYYEKGKPIKWTGGFSMVFPFENSNNKYAIKIWYNEIRDNQSRYKQIKDYLNKRNLPYFIDFEYIHQIIYINDIFYDGLRMDFINGLNLVEFISANLHNKEVLKKLGSEFLDMIQILRENEISHGDLQHGNIFITDDHKIKLIDYDSVCIPTFDGKDDICRGLQGYQLPSRFNTGFISSINIDHFSQLVIYTTILAVEENHLLWDKYNVPASEYRLLFTANDFHDWKNSNIRNELLGYSDQIRNLIEIFDSYINNHNSLPPFFI